MYKHIVKIIMQLIKRYIIQKNYPHKQEMDDLCFCAKNFYSYANFYIYQSFILKHKYLDIDFLEKQLKNFQAYLALSTQVVKKYLLGLQLNWFKFFTAIKIYTENKPEFLDRDKLLKYQHKEKSRKLLVYMAQIVSKYKMKADLTHLSPKHICVPTVVDYFCLHRVRNVPNIDHDVVEVVYEKEELDYDLKQDAIAAINVGRDNLAALTANQLRFVQFIIKGQIIKSINRYYNQQKAKLKSLLPTRKQTSKLLMLMVV